MFQETTDHPIDLVVLAAGPQPSSRIRAVAAAFGVEVAGRLPAARSWRDVVDLAGYGPGLVGVPSAAVAGLVDTVVSADVVVVATTVVKSSYGGLLKLFLDHLPDTALAGAVAVPVTLAPEPPLRRAAEAHLRPVLSGLGAALPVPGFAVDDGQLADVAMLADAWAARHVPAVVAHLAAGCGAARTPGRTLS